MSPIEFSGIAVAQLLQFSRVAQATKPAWSLLPTRWQFLPGTVVMAAVEIAAKLQTGVKSWVDLIIPTVLVLSTVAPGMRSNVHKALNAEAEKLAVDPRVPTFDKDALEMVVTGKKD